MSHRCGRSLAVAPVGFLLYFTFDTVKAALSAFWQTSKAYYETWFVTLITGKVQPVPTTK